MALRNEIGGAVEQERTTDAEVGVRIGVEMNRTGKEEKVWEGESNEGRIRVASGKSMSLC